MRTKLLGELRQNALDLLELFALQLANAIAGFDRGRRLDEERAAGRRCVVHDSADRALRFPAHGDDEAAIAHRHRHVGDALVRLELGHRALEELDELALRSLELAADVAQRRRRVVAHLSVVVDRALDRVFSRFVGDESARSVRREPRSRSASRGRRAANLA